jgi:cell division transport system permease protein
VHHEGSTQGGTRLGAWRAGRSDLRLHALSVFSLAVAFVCLAAALLVVTNIQAVRDRWARAGRATVYLRDVAPESDVTALTRALEETGGIQRVRRVSQEDARRELAANDEAMAALPPGAFPASIEVAFTDRITDEELKTIALRLRSLPAVESVETYDRWTERLSTLLSGGVTAAVCLALLVLGAVVSVVGSTMRLLLQRRKIEVEVLRLVGATNEFIRRPFVLEGATQGALGSAVAVGLVGLLFLLVKGSVDGQLATLVGVAPRFLPWEMALGMIALGGALGAATAFFSLRKLATI